MIKTLASIVREPGLSREAFAHHYEAVHVPLALSRIDAWQLYVRNHVGARLAGDEPDFDCLSAFGYRDLAGLDAVLEFMNSPESDALRSDELAFMDKPRNRFFRVEETWLRGDPMRRAEGVELEVIAMLRSVDPEADADRASRYDRELVGILLAEVGGLVECVDNVSLEEVAAGDPLRVSELRFVDADAARRSIENLCARFGDAPSADPKGFSVFEVRGCESPVSHTTDE